jgi:hypothetical protein
MRIKIIIESQNIDFIIPNFPEAPRIGDVIDLGTMVFHSTKLKQELQDKVYCVKSVTWTHDKDDYLLLVFCEPDT